MLSSLFMDAAVPVMGSWNRRPGNAARFCSGRWDTFLPLGRMVPLSVRKVPAMARSEINTNAKSPETSMITGFPGMCCLFPLEAHRQNPFENVATTLAFGMVFRDFRLLYFGSHEMCTQNVSSSILFEPEEAHYLSQHRILQFSMCTQKERSKNSTVNTVLSRKSGSNYYSGQRSENECETFTSLSSDQRNALSNPIESRYLRLASLRASSESPDL